MKNSILDPPINPSKEIIPKKAAGLNSVFPAIARGVIAIVASILILELVFRMSGIGADIRQVPDPVLGFVNMPGQEVVHRKEGYSKTTFNSFGMRNREVLFEKPAGVIRIAVIGDSATEAIQVADAETFCQRLENKLNAQAGQKKFEVLNFGVSAYNGAQEYVMFKERALKFHPDITIFMLRLNFIAFLGPPAPNKLSLLTSRPLCNLVGENQLSWTNALMEQWNFTPEAKRMRATAWLREHSRFWTVLGTVLCNAQTEVENTKSFLKSLLKPDATKASKSVGDQDQPSVASLDRKLSNSDFDSALSFLTKMLGALMVQANDLGAKSECKVIVFAQPLMDETNYSIQQQTLSRILKNSKVPYENLQTSFDKRAGDKRQTLFFSTNHPTAAGHEICADIMLNALKRHELLPTH